MSSIELKVEYLLQSQNNNDDKQTRELRKLLAFLDRLVLYLPTYCPILPSGRHRNTCFTLCITLMAIIFNTGFIVKGAFDTDYKHMDTIATINQVTLTVFFYGSRYIAMYYFYRHFNYPWYIKETVQIDEKHTKYINRFQRILKVAFTICVIYYIYKTIFHACITPNYFAMSVFRGIGNIIYDIIFYVFQYLSMFVIFAVHSTICLKNYYFLEQLISKMNDKQHDESSMNDALNKYKLLHDQFENDYHWSLAYTIQSFLFYIIMKIWMVLYYFFVIDGWGYIATISSVSDTTVYLLIYCISCSVMNEKYEECEEVLWKNADNNNYQFCQYFLSYLKEFPFTITFGGICIEFTVSKKNIFKAIAAFIVFKYIVIGLQYFGVEV